MSRPLHRGFSIGGQIDGRDPFDQDYKAKDFSGNGFGHELASPLLASKSRHNITLSLLRISLALVVILALSGSLYWTVSISTSSRVSIYKGYRRLQQQLIADLSDIGELSLGVSKFGEVDFCPTEYENYVPCYYNVSDSGDPEVSVEHERRCVRGSVNCLVLPPRNYRVPMRWPSGRDFIWKENVKITGQEFSSGSLTKRMMVEEDHISFHSDSLMVDGVEDYSHQIAEMIGLRNESNFNEAGVRTVLDIGCGFGSFGAHLFSKQLLTMCIANYESTGSQVQLTLERGLPAMIGSFSSKQLPFPYLSFDMLHCARCGIDWEKNDGNSLIEVDRLLRPGGYFVWTSLKNTQRSLRDKDNQKKWMLIHDYVENLCWDLLSQQDETVVWKKTSKKKCYSSRKSGPSLCGKSRDIESPYYQPLNPCIGGTRSQRWIPIEERTPWPSRAKLNSTELDIHGVHSEDFAEDALNWNSMVRNYWALLSPLIFSDHPKRPGDEDPSPPFNMLRNVLDMNARFGGFNAALLDAGKSVWAMNVVPTTGPNYLPLILDRGFIGVQHDWCEAFPTYPRTYDMVHAEGLLSIETHHQHSCSLLDIFLEIDRILRPEVQLIRIQLRVPEYGWTTQKLFHLMNFLVNGLRAILFGFYNNVFLLRPKVLEMVLLDLPGLLFFSTYTLLVLFWAEIYYQARSLSIDKLRPSYLTINGAVYIIQICIWISVQIKPNHIAVEVAKLFLAVVSLIAALGFLIYGGRLFVMLRRFPIESKGRQKKLNEVGFVTAICSTCFLVKCFVVTLSAFNKDADLDVLNHPLLNFIYYMLVEILPSALVLFILRKLPPKRVSDQYHPIN